MYLHRNSGGSGLKSLLIILLAVTLGWTVYRLGDIERQRYALLIGMCTAENQIRIDTDCLERAEPRTSRAWNIFYGLLP